MDFISGNEQETIQIGYDIGKILTSGSIVGLCGDLGAGKTALVRGICRACNIDDITSPTFSLVNEYEGNPMVYHFDAYRIDADGWFDLGFDEYLYKGGICVIEWADNIQLPPCHMIYIEGSGDAERRITYENTGA